MIPISSVSTRSVCRFLASVPRSLRRSVLISTASSTSGSSRRRKLGSTCVTAQAPSRLPSIAQTKAGSSTDQRRRTRCPYCQADMPVPQTAALLLVPKSVAGEVSGKVVNRAGIRIRPPPPTMASTRPAAKEASVTISHSMMQGPGRVAGRKRVGETSTHCVTFCLTSETSGPASAHVLCTTLKAHVRNLCRHSGRKSIIAVKARAGGVVYPYNPRLQSKSQSVGEPPDA